MKLLVSALEPSANLHLEPILKGLEDVEICGIFDKKFGKALYSSDEFSVMGILDVIGKIFKAKEAIKELVFLAKDCDKVLLIDSPAFNIPLAKAIKEAYHDKEIIYYILPKVWAWKKSRAKLVQKYCDKICSIFPFEDKFFESSIYVGNPLLDEIKLYHDTQEKNTVAFLPGSRKSEIKKLMPIFRDVAKKIDKKKLLVIPKFFNEQKIQDFYGDISDFKVVFSTEEALSSSDFAFVCSGTATLESAIIGTPFVLVYKAKKIDYFIGKLFVKLPYVGLANILMDFENKEPIHKEFLQDEVTVKNLLNEYRYHDKQKFLKSSQDLKDVLKFGSAKNMINIIKEV